MSATSQFAPSQALPEITSNEGARRRASGLTPAVFPSLITKVIAVVSRIAQLVKVQSKRRNLRLCESLSLGEKRFVAVVQVDGERLLIGGSSNSVSLLTRLQPSFTEALRQSRKEEPAS